MNVSPRMSSLEKKPASGGMPASDSAPMSNVQWVIGIVATGRPSGLMSCSSWTAWMTEPEPRNSRPLEKPWAMRWKIAATKAPTPSAANM